MTANGRDFSAVRVLLASWNLPELEQHFEDEGINIEELQMMKPHQLSMVLQNFKLGTRIRFEHCFEKWRRDTNRPLYAGSSHTILKAPECQCLCSNEPLKKARVEHTTIGINTDVTGDFMQNKSGVDSNDVAVPVATPTQPEVPKLLPMISIPKDTMPRLTPQPRLSRSQHSNEQQSGFLKLKPTSELTIPAVETTITGSPAYADHSKSYDNNSDTSTDQGSFKSRITVIDILEEAGSRGTNIIEYYKEHKTLTPTHRALLIQLIVDFFDHNNIHLSLFLSHSIEQQILNIFPNETIEDYRTEKRGRLYVKFCNMKRYRRERPWPEKSKRRNVDLAELTPDKIALLHDDNSAQRSTESISPHFLLENGDMDEGDDSQLFDWMNGREERIQVKHEAINDDDERFQL